MNTKAIALAIGLAFSASALGMSADELIAKNIEARGGQNAIDAVNSLKITGRLSFAGGGFEFETSMLKARPNSMRFEGTVQGMTMVQAYDGAKGWAIRPFGGRKDPIPMSEDEVKQIQDMADFDGALINAKAKGHVIDYLGLEDVDGTPAHKLKVTKKNGDIKYLFLDPDYFLEIRAHDVQYIRGEANESETDYGSYEKVNGVYFPFSIETGGVGSSEKGQKFTFEKIEANVPVDASVFAFPEAKP